MAEVEQQVIAPEVSEPEPVKVGKSKSRRQQVSVVTKAASRPLATVYSLNGRPLKRAVKMPTVMLAPIRSDIVNFVHTQMAKNNRQPYGVQWNPGPKGRIAGMKNSGKSWGTGRAVSRVARVRGGGTHRAGQGAFGK